jgi:glycosyltransferase involved in cell wall biosynthesis
MQDFLVHERNGFVIPINDEDALLAALRRVIAAGPEVERAGRAGRATAVERFSHEAVTVQWLGLFDPPARASA